MHRRYARGADDAAVQRMNGPSAIEAETAGGANGGGLYFDGVEGFDRVDLDAGQAGNWCCERTHRVILAERNNLGALQLVQT